MRCRGILNLSWTSLVCKFQIMQVFESGMQMCMTVWYHIIPLPTLILQIFCPFLTTMQYYCCKLLTVLSSVCKKTRLFRKTSCLPQQSGIHIGYWISSHHKAGGNLHKHTPFDKCAPKSLVLEASHMLANKMDNSMMNGYVSGFIF